MIRIEGLGKPEGCKVIRIQAVIEADIIKAIQIRGDFFASPEEDFEKVEQSLAGLSPAEVAGSFDTRIREAGIEVFGISGAGLAEVLFSALRQGDEVHV